jgi:hypothetical protein
MQKLLVFYILKYNNKAVKAMTSKFTLQLSLYIYILCTLSDNILFICMSFRNRNKSKLLMSITPFDHLDIGPVFIGTFVKQNNVL